MNNMNNRNTRENEGKHKCQKQPLLSVEKTILETESPYPVSFNCKDALVCFPAA